MNASDMRTRRLHERSLDLAAMAVDYELTRAEQVELEAHLATCTTCARRAAAVRADALALSRPSMLQPSRRVDDAVHAEIARPTARPTRLGLVVAAALLLAAILGALAVGAYLLREPSPLQTTVVPVPTASPIATRVTSPPGPTATAAATVRPDPTAFPPAFVLPTEAELVYNVGEGQAHRTIAIGTVGGSGVREVALGQDPSFLSDADQIVYACTDAKHDPDPVGICLTRLSGGTSSRVVDDPTARSPQWEPNGARFTYNNGMIDLGEAWIADKDGSSARMLAAGGAPIWSRDGLWLAYQPEGATFHVAIIRPDGSGKRDIGSGYDPAWSPASPARLVFARADGSNGALIVASADVSSKETVVFQATSPVHHPVWLDENHIAFWMDGDLWRIDLLVSDTPNRLTTGLGVTDGAELSVTEGWLMFSSPDLAGGRIHVVGDKGGWALAPLDVGPVSRPIWRPAP